MLFIRNLIIGGLMELAKIVSVGIYNTDIAVRRGTHTRKRTTAMFELELPMECGGVSYIDSEESPIRPDMLICSKPGQTRYTKLPFKCYYIHIIINEGILRDSLLKMPNYIRLDDREKYLGIFERMHALYDGGREEDEILLESLLLKLIHNLICKEGNVPYTSHGSENRKGRMIERAVKYIEENLTSDLSLETLASHFGFSPIHFHNTFKTSIGKTLHCYVEERRIKKAERILVATDKNLAEIAYECGFSSQSYFSFAFKRRMGVTPREYVTAHYEMYGIEK